MSIELEGIEALIHYLNKLDDEHIDETLKKACLVVERSAKEKAPKGTGELRRSIKSKVEDKQGIIFTPIEYAPYVEYGTGIHAENGGRTDVPWRYQDDKGDWHSTSGMKPHPYMRPALYENVDKIKDVIKKGILKK